MQNIVNGLAFQPYSRGFLQRVNMRFIEAAMSMQILQFVVKINTRRRIKGPVIPFRKQHLACILRMNGQITDFFCCCIKRLASPHEIKSNHILDKNYYYEAGTINVLCTLSGKEFHKYFIAFDYRT